MNPLLATVADVLFPASCASCRALLPRLGLFCTSCQEEADAACAPFCERCGLPLASDKCPDCAELLPPAQSFDRARALYVYRGSVEKALLRAKFGGAPAICDAAGEVMGRALADGRVPGLERRPDAICWIPVGRRRLAQRGYDQSALIAQRVARIVDRPLLRHELRRRRETPAQSLQNRAARARNVCNAFALRRPRRVEGLCVLLIDDLLTTGHTAQAAALVLKRASAQRVEVLTLARASFDELD